MSDCDFQSDVLFLSFWGESNWVSSIELEYRVFVDGRTMVVGWRAKVVSEDDYNICILTYWHSNKKVSLERWRDWTNYSNKIVVIECLRENRQCYSWICSYYNYNTYDIEHFSCFPYFRSIIFFSSVRQRVNHTFPLSSSPHLNLSPFSSSVFSVMTGIIVRDDRRMVLKAATDSIIFFLIHRTHSLPPLLSSADPVITVHPLSLVSIPLALVIIIINSGSTDLLQIAGQTDVSSFSSSSSPPPPFQRCQFHRKHSILS